MDPNKTSHQLQAGHHSVQKELAARQNRRMRLSLLDQVQRQGVIRPDLTWCLPDSSK